MDDDRGESIEEKVPVSGTGELESGMRLMKRRWKFVFCAYHCLVCFPLMPI